MYKKFVMLFVLVILASGVVLAGDCADARQTGDLKTVTVDGIEYRFRWCPAGSFQMGGESGYDDSKPAHTVKLTQGFWMLETEVTQLMWKSVMGINPSPVKEANLPVVRVRWDECQDFCEKLSEKGLKVQLPTEAQWEYACRAGTTGDYAGNLDGMGWHDGNSGIKAHEVGMKKPNAWGLYDMHGNVWEWCSDWYDPKYYDKSPTSNPTGAPSGNSRIVRGGSWNFGAGISRSAIRYGYSINYRGIDLGFRVVRIIE